jgi:rSAM/selenodomain-associated transferase 2
MISIIIPTFNEEKNIEKLIPYLQGCCLNKPVEIVVSDCGSTDNTRDVAATLGAKVMVCSCKSRAVQMNSGANVATYNIFYFVHADTFPPATFYYDIIKAVEEGFDIGRYRTKFNGSNPLLRLNEYFTRFDLFFCYGGDQTLFMCKSLFDELHGFNNMMLIMEEYDLVKRARQYGRYKIFDAAALVSSRKYEDNSWLKVQRANYKIMQQYKKGVPQVELVKNYRRLLKNLK